MAILTANNKFEKTDAILNTFEDQDNNSDDDEISHNVDELDIIREESLIDSVKITLTQFLASNSKSVYYINVLSGLMNTSLAWNSDQIEANLSLFYCQFLINKKILLLWEALLTRKNELAETDFEELDDINQLAGAASSLSAILKLEFEKDFESGFLSTQFYQFQIGDNFQAVTICNIIHTILLLNKLQHLIVEQVFQTIIDSKGKQCINKDSQMLLYVRGEGGVGKSRVIKIIKIRFSLLYQKPELVITALTGAAATNIGGATIHAALDINDYGLLILVNLYQNYGRIDQH